MDYKEILTGVLAKTLNIGNGEAVELIKDDENATESAIIKRILDADKDRVNKLRTTSKEQDFQDGYKKAKREQRQQFEDEIRSEFGVESSKTGTDLIKEILTQNQASGNGNMTDEDVMKTKPYQDLLTKMKTEVNAVKESYETQISEIKADQQRQKTFALVGQTAVEKLNALNPILSSNPEINENIKNLFIQTILDKYDVQEKDGKIEVLGKDGKIAIDGHGNPLNYDELVKTTASKFYEFKANNGGSNAGNEGAGGSAGQAGGYPAGIVKPKTIEELTKILDDDTIPIADRVTISEAYNKESQGIV